MLLTHNRGNWAQFCDNLPMCISSPLCPGIFPCPTLISTLCSWSPVASQKCCHQGAQPPSFKHPHAQLPPHRHQLVPMLPWTLGCGWTKVEFCCHLSRTFLFRWDTSRLFPSVSLAFLTLQGLQQRELVEPSISSPRMLHTHDGHY